MTELIIKSDRADAVKSEVQSALENQRRTVQDSLKRTERHIAGFEEKYGFATAELLKREESGAIDDDNLEFIEWLGEVKTLEYLKGELELLSDIKVC